MKMSERWSSQSELLGVIFSDYSIQAYVCPETGQTLLMYALENNWLAAAEILMHRNVLNIRDIYSRGILNYCAALSNPERAIYFFKQLFLIIKNEQYHPDEVLCRLFLKASEEGNIQLIQYLLEHDLLNTVKIIDEYEQSALHLAATKSDLKTLQFLLSKLDNPNCQDVFGNTALHWVARTGKVEAVKIFLQDSRVEFHCKNFKGQTPLDCAIEQHGKIHGRLGYVVDSQPIIDLLIQHLGLYRDGVEVSTGSSIEPFNSSDTTGRL